MKKYLSIITCAVVALLFASCGDNAVLSEGAAKKALKKEAMFAKDSYVGSFQVGYYEASESQLNRLAQLKAAGMVQYTANTITETVTRSTYNYWSGRQYYTTTQEHVFVQVELTEEGEKYVVANPTTERADIAKDFASNKDYEENIPDYMFAQHGSAPAAALVAEVEVAEAVEVDSIEAVVEAVVEEEPEPAQANNNPNASYEAAKARVHVTDVNVLLGWLSLEKVKEVRCSKDMADQGEGTCVAIVTFKDKTPFGYVLGAPRQDYLESIKVSFVYYNDMGWTVSSIKN